MNFGEHLLNKSLNEIQKRMSLLVLNSFLYKQSLNESFIESSGLYKGKSGLNNKYLVRFDKAMRSKSIKELEDFQSKHINNLSKLSSDYKKIDYNVLGDVRFITENGSSDIER